MDCETCYYNDYDEELDCEVCLMQIDQDEWARVMEHHTRCPYYRQGDDYYLASKQQKTPPKGQCCSEDVLICSVYLQRGNTFADCLQKDH